VFPIRRFLLLLLPWVFLLSGCADSNNSILRMDLQTPVHNLDPQFTTEATAQTILLNLGEGLMIWDGEELSQGVAKSYTVSEDGLTYEFTLREDARWQDGEPVLASHFVFGFQRMFTPGATSPHAEQFKMLKGAQAILEGKGFLRNLGVEAPEPNRVVFHLEYPSPTFLELLATAPALPCREDYFAESKGRYGLERRYVLSNGPFVLSRWDNETSIRLERNDAYVSPRGPARPQRVVFYIGRGDPVNLYDDGKSDLLQVLPNRLESIKETGEVLSLQNRVWCLVFNQNASVWANPLLRQSLAYTVDSSQYQPLLKEGQQVSHLFMPPAVTLQGKSVRKSEDHSPISFNPRQAKRLLALGLEAEGLERIPAASLLAPAEYRNILTPMIQNWQQYLNLSVYPQFADLDGLKQRLEQEDYQILLYPFSADDTGPDAMLRRFTSEHKDNHTGYHNPRYDLELESAGTQADSARALEAYADAEELLLRDAVVVPLFWESTTFVMAPNVTGVKVTPGGVILFHGASKA